MVRLIHTVQKWFLGALLLVPVMVSCGGQVNQIYTDLFALKMILTYRA